MKAKYFLQIILALLGSIIFSACSSEKEIVVGPTTELPTAPPITEETVRFGVLTKRSITAANQEWGDLIKYLSDKLDHPVTLVAVSQDDPFSVVEGKAVDFIYANSLVAVQLKRFYGVQLLATTSRPELGTQFAGLIISRKDSGIESLEDLRGKRGVCVKFGSAAGGYAFQSYLLKENGLDPHQIFTSFVEAKTQDNTVLAVLNDSADVGFIRTGQLEAMIEEGTIQSMDEFNIIHKIDDDFPLVHSTRLYPEWAWTAAPDTDPDLAQRVQEILLDIPINHQVLKAAGAEKIVPLVDYQPIEDLIIALKLPSWDSD